MPYRQLVMLLGLAATPLVAQERAVAVTAFETEGSVGLAADEYDALGRALGVYFTSELSARRTGAVTTLSASTGGRAGRVDAAQARQRATAAGAAVVVIGSVLDQYGDVHLEAKILDAASGASIAVIRGDPALATREQLGEAIAELTHRVVKEGAVGGAGEARWRRTIPSKALLSFGRGLRAEEQGDRTKAVAAYREALATAPTLTEAKTALSRVGG